MGSMDGVALAKAVRKAGGTMQIVFVTGYSDYIAEGHDVEALNYLMKPVDAARLFDVPDKAVAACAAIPGALIRNARKG